MRYRLRTLLILLAVLPPLIAWWGWPTMQRILWPPKPNWQFIINNSGNGLSENGLVFDFAFPVQPAPPPTANTAPPPSAQPVSPEKP